MRGDILPWRVSGETLYTSAECPGGHCTLMHGGTTFWGDIVHYTTPALCQFVGTYSFATDLLFFTHMASVCLVRSSFLPQIFFLPGHTELCCCSGCSINHRLCIWHFEVSCPKLLGLSRIHTIWRTHACHMHDEFIKLNKITYAPAKIRQDMHMA